MGDGTPPNLPVIKTLDDTGQNAYVELVMSQCKICSKFGPWVMVVRDRSGRITEYDTWDVSHADDTGHASFYQFKLTRSNSRVL